MSTMRLMEAVTKEQRLQGGSVMQYSTNLTLSDGQTFAPALKMADCFAADKVDNFL